LNVRFDRVASIQAAMRERGWIALVVLNHDDYRYLFGTDRTQPRALIPFQGPPELIAFSGEEPELRASLAEGKVRVFRERGRPDHDIVGGCARSPPPRRRNGLPRAASRSDSRCGSPHRHSWSTFSSR